MFKAGDVIEMKDPEDGMEYAVTKPGTRWLVYGKMDDVLIRVGTLSHNGMTPDEMIERYSVRHDKPYLPSRIIDNRFRDNIRIYTVRIKDCQPVGNNAIFKSKLLQGDMWEEHKDLAHKRIDWDDIPF